MIWIGFTFGVLISATIALVYIFMMKKANHKDFLKGYIQLVEDTRDWLYYFETKPKWRYKFVFPKFSDPRLNKLIYENPHHLLNRVHPDDYEMLIKKINGEVDFSKPILYRIANFNNEYIWFEEFTTPVYKNGELVAIQGILRNIQEKMKLKADLDYRISHDSLTGIYNRDFFELNKEKYNKEINVPVGFILCDLDKLKYINDTNGHKVGDRYIVEAASLLNRFSSDKVIVSRIGGDEYCIIVLEAVEADVTDLKKSILESIIQYNKNQIDMKIEMSIGYAYIPNSIGNMDQLFVDADQNMYQEKYKRKMIRTH